MIVAKKSVSEYRVYVHDFTFCTLYKNDRFVHHSAWTCDECKLAKQTLQEALSRMDELPAEGLRVLRL
jgi:hypothetical protein